MPCYELRTMSVEFKAKSIEYLVKAAENLGYHVSMNRDQTILKIGRMTIKLDEQKADISNGTYAQDRLNELKREYSKVTIEAIAKKKRWVLKQNKKKDFSFTAMKY